MLKSLSKYVPEARKSTSHKVVEGLAYAGLSYGYGYVQNRYREKASLGPVPLDLGVGVLAKAASVFFGSHLGHFGGSLADIAGNAGIGAFAHTLGAGSGAKASGVRRLLVSEKDLDKVKKVLPSATVLGDIGPAPHGDYLRPGELEEMGK